MSYRAWRVDSRVVVDGLMLDACHSCQFQYHVAVLAAAVCHLNRLVVALRYGLQQPHGSVNLLL
jgi:hypothetical protein